MSWTNFQDEAFNLTRLEVRNLSRQITDQYRQAMKTINEQLIALYAEKLSGIAPSDYYNHMLKKNRLQNLLSQIKAEYTQYSRRAGTLSKNTISLAFSNVYYRKAYDLNWLVPNVKVGILPSSLVELSTLGTKEAWDNVAKSVIKKYGERVNYVPQRGTLSSLLLNNRTSEVKKIQDAITQGLINGTSKRDTVKQISNIIGLETTKDGKKVLSGAKASAERIVRTETNRTMNMGSYAQSKYADSKDVKIRRRLLAVLDTRTRAQSASMDGQERAVDKPFTYPDGKRAMTPGTTGNPAYDANDRETVIDIVNDNPPQIRRGRNPVTGDNEVFEYKSFSEWAKENNLTKNKYGQIVG